MERGQRARGLVHPQRRAHLVRRTLDRPPPNPRLVPHEVEARRLGDERLQGHAQARHVERSVHDRAEGDADRRDLARQARQEGFYR